MHAPDGTVIRGPERRQSPRTVGKPVHRCVAPPVPRFSCVQAAPPAPFDFSHHFCEVRLFQVSPSGRLLVCRRVGSLVFFAKTSREVTQLRGFLCAPSSSGLAGAGKLAAGSVQRPDSITAVRFSIAVVVVDLTRCFCFAKTVPKTRSATPVTIWKLGRTVCVYSMVQRREKEKNSRYIQDASTPAAVTVYQTCNIMYICNNSSSCI
jgi:hypothetical protein